MNYVIVFSGVAIKILWEGLKYSLKIELGLSIIHKILMGIINHSKLLIINAIFTK